MTISGRTSTPLPIPAFPVFNQTYNTLATRLHYDNMTTYPLGSVGGSAPQADGLLYGRPLPPADPHGGRLFQREAWRYELLSADAPDP